MDGPCRAPVLAARHAGAHEAEPGAGEIVGASVGVDEVGVAAVDQDVSLLQVRAQVRDHAVHGGAGRHHHQDAARPLEHLHQPLGTVHAGDRLALGRALEETFRLLGVEVVTRDREALALDVQGQVAAHHAEADHTHLVAHVARSAPRLYGSIAPPRRNRVGRARSRSAAPAKRSTSATWPRGPADGRRGRASRPRAGWPARLRRARSASRRRGGPRGPHTPG
jgi:hypothetical protein